MEKTLVLIKPDALQRGLAGQIISRFEKKGLKLMGLKMLTADHALLDKHYAHLKDKDFFQELKKFMGGSPVIAMVWEGLEAVQVVRDLAGPTVGRQAPPGTIRGDFSLSTQANIIHASDSVVSAKKEITRFFQKNEIFNYYKDEYFHLYGLQEIPDKYKKHYQEASKRRS